MGGATVPEHTLGVMQMHQINREDALDLAIHV